MVPRLNGAISAYVPKHPATALDLAKLKTTGAALSFHNRVEAYYYRLIPNARFRALMDSVVAYASVEGSISSDENAAARMVRELAKGEKDDVVAEAKADMRDGVAITSHGDYRVVKSLRVVARRHQMSRTKRLAEAKEALRLSSSHVEGNPTEH